MNRIPKSLGLFLAFLISFSWVGAQNVDDKPPQTLSSNELGQRARRAFRNRDLRESKRLFELLWKRDDAGLEDVTLAGRMLAYFEHHFFNNMDGVYPYYEEILKRNPHRADYYLRLADYELRSHRFQQAAETLRRARQEDLSVENRRDLVILSNKVRLEQFLWENTGPPDLEQLHKELSNIQDDADRNPEDVELAYLQMGLSLILKKTDIFWEGWHNYFRLPRDRQARSFLAQSQESLTRGLTAWERGTVSRDLIEGLALSRLYDLAMMMFKFDATGLDKQPYGEDLGRYYRYLHQTQENGFSYYRKKALGNNDGESFFADQDKLDLWIWGQLMGKEEKESYSRRNLESELYKRYGLKMMFSGRGESRDLIIFGGHGYIEETVQIEQYGRRGAFKYIKLHNLVGNIYDHWYQDYVGIGGWASTDGNVMQVRNWYVNYPVSVWNRLTDPAAREKWLDGIKTRMKNDAELLAKDPTAIPAGLADHIKFLRYDQLIRSLRQKGLTGKALKLAFFSEVEYFFEYTGMHLHEARHVLDNPLSLADREKYPLEVREFRAKLSEIGFSPDPHLVVAESILEDGTANRDVIAVIVEWMQKNKKAIDRYDPSKPALLQLLNLEKDQLIEAVRSADPFSPAFKKGA